MPIWSRGPLRSRRRPCDRRRVVPRRCLGPARSFPPRLPPARPRLVGRGAGAVLPARWSRARASARRGRRRAARPARRRQDPDRRACGRRHLRGHRRRGRATAQGRRADAAVLRTGRRPAACRRTRARERDRHHRHGGHVARGAPRPAACAHRRGCRGARPGAGHRGRSGRSPPRQARDDRRPLRDDGRHRGRGRALRRGRDVRARDHPAPAGDRRAACARRDAAPGPPADRRRGADRLRCSRARSGSWQAGRSPTRSPAC